MFFWTYGSGPATFGSRNRPTQPEIEMKRQQNLLTTNHEGFLHLQTWARIMKYDEHENVDDRRHMKHFWAAFPLTSGP